MLKRQYHRSMNGAEFWKRHQVREKQRQLSAIAALSHLTIKLLSEVINRYASIGGMFDFGKKQVERSRYASAMEFEFVLPYVFPLGPDTGVMTCCHPRTGSSPMEALSIGD
jgi:hypothetical protein